MYRHYLLWCVWQTGRCVYLAVKFVRTRGYLEPLIADRACNPLRVAALFVLTCKGVMLYMFSGCVRVFGNEKGASLRMCVSLTIVAHAVTVCMCVL